MHREAATLGEKGLIKLQWDSNELQDPDWFFTGYTEVYGQNEWLFHWGTFRINWNLN